MDSSRFDSWTRRRFGLAAGGLAAGLLSLTRFDAAAAKALCTSEGTKCKEKSRKCKASNCLHAPFTIEAKWTTDSDHDTYLFVPHAVGSTDPAPHITYSCNPPGLCETAYPFACVSEDATGPGNEITTIHKRLNGKYEYWIELESTSPAGDLTITLRNKGGNKVRSWSSPAVPGTDQIGWHVFDIKGNTGSITSIDHKIGTDLPDGAHDPNTDVCP